MLLPCRWVTAQISLPNGTLKNISPGRTFPDNWIAGVGAGTDATASIDNQNLSNGLPSIRMHDATATAAYKYLIVNTDWFSVEPETTYLVKAKIKGQSVGKLFIGAALEGSGENRQPLPSGSYPWQEVSFRVTVPAETRRLSIQFVADGITENFWFADVRIEHSPVQLARLTAQGHATVNGEWFARTPGRLPKSLLCTDISRESTEMCGALTALQGIVNRKSAQLYLINPTNPPGYDTLWLNYLQQKGYTGKEQQISPIDAITHFRKEITGVIIWDPTLPGSRNAAWMIGSIKNALPVSPELAKTLNLPIVEDLRGRWTRNVDAYRYV